jgi:hypothetical protein
MIKNRNLDPDSRVRVSGIHHFDLSGDSDGAVKYPILLMHPNNKIKIRKILVLYTVTSDDTDDNPILYVGTVADPDLYYLTALPDDQAAGTFLQLDPAVATLLPKQTGIVVSLESKSVTNAGEVDVAIEYEVVDRAVA